MASVDDEFGAEAENAELRRLLAKAGVDAAAQEVARKLQRVLLEELHHRVKNILATVQAITSLSLGGGAQPRRRPEGHPEPPARTGPRARSAAADELVQGQAPVGRGSSHRALRCVGAAPVPATRTRRRCRAECGPPALVLNELCTNAVKYGALSSEGGRVDIDASIQDGDERVLLMKWAERDGPPVVKPQSRGFGSALIEHAFVAQLEGKARLDFDPAGVQYQLEVPLAALQRPTSD